MSVRRLWRWTGIGLCVALTVGIGSGWPRERLVTEAARPITALDTQSEDYVWVSDSRLIVVTCQQKGDDFVRGARRDWRGMADLIDTGTYARTRLTGLTELLNRTAALPCVNASDFEVSPDGGWLQWQTYGRRDDLAAPNVARLDGTHYQGWDRNSYEESLFLGSGHLYQKRGDDSAIVRDLWKPSQDHVYPKGEEAQAAFLQYAVGSPEFLIVPSRESYGSRSCTIEHYRAQDRLALLLWEGDRYEKKRKELQPIRKQKVDFAMGTELERAYVSPSQNSIFYLLRRKRTSLLRSLLHRIWSKIDVPETWTEELWCSLDDGSELHELGYVSIAASADRGFEEVKWLPGGRQISFVCHGQLYCVTSDLSAGRSRGVNGE